MAQTTEVKQNLFIREYVNSAKGQQFKFYDVLEDAIQDADPRLKMLVYSVTTDLLGEIKTVLVPITAAPLPATKVLIRVDAPKG